VSDHFAIKPSGINGYEIRLPRVSILRINCGRRPQFSRLRLSGVYKGGMEVGEGHWQWSWDLASQRWRAVRFDFALWRVTIKLWEVPAERIDRGRPRGRLELLRFAFAERGHHDDNLSPGWWLPEEKLPQKLWELGITGRAWFPGAWKMAMLLKLTVAVLLLRERAWDWDTEEWMAACFDGNSYASMEGTFHEWTELRTPDRWLPRYWTYNVNREST